MIIKCECKVCGKELDPFDLKRHDCKPPEKNVYNSKADLDHRLFRLMCDKLTWEMTTDGHTTPRQIGIEARRRIAGQCYCKPVSAFTLGKPMSAARIEALAEYHGIDSLYETGRLDFARAIEQEHDIK